MGENGDREVREFSKKKQLCAKALKGTTTSHSRGIERWLRRLIRGRQEIRLRGWVRTTWGGFDLSLCVSINFSKDLIYIKVGKEIQSSHVFPPPRVSTRHYRGTRVQGMKPASIHCC